MKITSVININKKVDLPSVNKYQTFGKKFKNIIKYSILHTPSKVGVLVSIIFSDTPEEVMSGGLAKACVPSKIVSVEEKLSFLMKLFCYSMNNLNIRLWEVHVFPLFAYKRKYFLYYQCIL